MITAQQIVADALAIAKCPGFTAQGGRAINLVLTDLVLHRNLKMNVVTQTIAVGAGLSGPFNLEADFLRTHEIYYVQGNQPFFLTQRTRPQFDADNIPNSGTGYPSEYATDLSAQAAQGLGLLYVYPTSSAPLSLIHRYFLQRADITMPETSAVIPWFTDQDYLIHATAMRVMRITDDSRYSQYVADCETMLRTHLLTEGDEQQVVHEVKLDPRRFRTGGGIKSTKSNPF